MICSTTDQQPSHVPSSLKLLTPWQSLKLEVTASRNDAIFRITFFMASIPNSPIYFFYICQSFKLFLLYRFPSYLGSEYFCQQLNISEPSRQCRRTPKFIILNIYSIFTPFVPFPSSVFLYTTLSKSASIFHRLAWSMEIKYFLAMLRSILNRWQFTTERHF